MLVLGGHEHRPSDRVSGGTTAQRLADSLASPCSCSRPRSNLFATGSTKLTKPRAQLAAGPMRWAADVTDVEFRTVGLLECWARSGWSYRAHWASRRFSPRSQLWVSR